MKCAYEGLLAKFLDEDLSSDERQEVEKHLPTCPECLQTFATYKRIAAATPQLPIPGPSPDLLSKVLQRIHAPDPVVVGRGIDSDQRNPPAGAPDDSAAHPVDTSREPSGETVALTSETTSKPPTLEAVETPERDIGKSFQEIFRPLSRAFFYRHGLPQPDADRLAEASILRVATVDLGQGREALRSFKDLLFRVCQEMLGKIKLNQRNHEKERGSFEEAPGTAECPIMEDLAAWWDQAYRSRILELVAERIRGEFSETTWLAFWKTAIEGKSLKEAAAELGTTTGAVALEKGRVLERVEQVIDPEALE